MRQLYLPNDFFNVFPTETIKASELKTGDLFKNHNAWRMVSYSKLEQDYYNNGRNLSVYVVSENSSLGSSFFKPDEEVTVILRSLINPEMSKKIIDQSILVAKEHERLLEIEEKEERQRLRDMRDDLNRELGEE